MVRLAGAGVFADLAVARGVPLAFRGYREWSVGTRHPSLVASGIPGERSVVEAT